jgi:hypothetical protein
VPATLRRHLPDFEVKTVRQLGWDSMLDGELLRAADQQFDAFVTVDRNLVYQQNLSGISSGVVVLVAPSNNIRDLLPLVPELKAVLLQVAAGEVRYVPGLQG